MSSSAAAAVARVPERPDAPSSSDFFGLARESSFLLSLVLVVVTLTAYNPASRNGFVNFDDPGYVGENAHTQAGLTWTTIRWSFTTYEHANWHPLTWFSHALDCQVFGLNPAGHHYMSVLLHACDVVLLFLLLRSATGFCWRSVVVAALFALHPINVESVAWISERKNVLSMMFFLLALLAYTGYARQPGIRRYAVVALTFALALMAKPQVVTFPLLLFLWDYWPLGRIGAPAVTAPSPQIAPPARVSTAILVMEKLPLLALAAGSSYVTIQAQKASGSLKGLSLYSMPLRLESTVIAYVRYLGKAVWPSNLAVLYPHPTRLYSGWQISAALALLSIVTVLSLRARNQRYLAVGWLWFLISLLPMIGLVQVGAQAMADRYAHVPFIGLFVMLTWLAADWAGTRQKPRPAPIAWLAAGAACGLIALGVATFRQIGYWRDTETLWNHTLAVTDENFYAHDVLGYYLNSQGRADEGAVQFRDAVAIRPEDPEANMNLGSYEEAHGHPQAAVRHYQMVAFYSANLGMRATAYFNLGHVYRKMGDLATAKKCFETVLQLAPDQPIAIVGLGLIAEQNGDAAEAVHQFSRAVALQPSDVGSLLLAHALQQEARGDEAKAILERVARSSPDFSQAQQTAVALLSGN